MKAKSLALVLVCLSGIAAALPAQFCPGDDGLLVPGVCCQPSVAPNLPVFPILTLPTEGACFLDCSVEAVFPATMVVGPVVQVYCDLFIIPISIVGGPPMAPGFMVARYARTWMEYDPTGVATRQVWRFLVNTDMTYQQPYQPPCPTPACAAQAGLPVHFVGNLDYAQDCSVPNVTDAALSLTHFCGDMSHGPYSSRQTNFSHPERLFCWVAPAPFDFSPPAAGTTPAGPVFGDTVRAAAVNLANNSWICHSEMFLSGGSMNLIQTNCSCSSFASAFPRWELMDLHLDYGCNTPGNYSYITFPFPPMLPTGFSMFPLGTYLSPITAFPGPRTVRVCMGLAGSADPCAGNWPLHIVNGVVTTHPFPGQPFSTPVASSTFIDLQNTLVVTNTPPYLITGYGSLFGSSMLWNANL